MTYAKKPDNTLIFPPNDYLDEAIESARLAMICLDEMRTFLCAMRDLSKNNEVVYDLGKTAIEMAGDRRNMFDVMREEWELKKTSEK
ncbi:hypothetical protein [Paraherbaspirillum soli]|uniref:DUF3077 domain-containing protein n=1 Tax=Paraherbaspirillum soli TaxID=631222 RepID=A0ABW0MFH7_9BURK